jgi:hypothetical protein
MNKQYELSGTVVLVRPSLVNDPDNKKNMVGVIVMASVENDNVLVDFGFEGHALFSINALLVLRKPDDIHSDVMNDATLFGFRGLL